MKKKLEAELISIAHRILKLKNKADLVQLHQETQRLYEKLSVLRFVEENFADVKPTIGYAEMEGKLAEIFDNDATATAAEQPVSRIANEPAKQEVLADIVSGIAENATQQEVIEEATEPFVGPDAIDADEAHEIALDEEVQAAYKIDEETSAAATATAETSAELQQSEAESKEETAQDSAIVAQEPEPETPKAETFKPAFEWGFDAKTETPSSTDAPKIVASQISFDDLLGQDYVDPVFVKPEEMHAAMPSKTQSEDERRSVEMAESNRKLADLMAGRKSAEVETRQENVIPISRNFVDTSNVIPINKDNLNERMGKGITIGLNDRIAFMKHLFNNSSEDYNRVLSQLLTIGTLEEAKIFIDQIVKPDYNNWDGKDEYEQRFMEIVERKFT